MAYTLGIYQNEDIKQQTIDLLNNLSNTPGVGGVTLVGEEVTPYMERITGETTIESVFRSISISNTGDADGTVLGAVLKSGETVTFAATGNNFFSGITMDATGTEFLMIKIN